MRFQKANHWFKDHRAVGDFEMLSRRSMYRAVGGFAQLYVLGALESGRARLQILHENDECCFRAQGLHDKVRAYNAYVQAHAAGWTTTAVTAGKRHVVSEHDWALASHAIEALRAGSIGGWRASEQLPHNLLVYPGL